MSDSVSFRYIFPGADASLPLGWVIRQLERANFEIHSVETIGQHYGYTIHRWYQNWMSNKYVSVLLSKDVTVLQRKDYR